MWPIDMPKGPNQFKELNSVGKQLKNIGLHCFIGCGRFNALKHDIVYCSVYGRLDSCGILSEVQNVRPCEILAEHIRIRHALIKLTVHERCKRLDETDL